MRFYSFVAGHYLSPLQCGLQTAHAVSEMSIEPLGSPLFYRWAAEHKTIIILNAINSKGVIEAAARLKEFAVELDLPYSLFCEDEESLNGAATAAGIIVPEKYYAAEKTEYNHDCFVTRDETGDLLFPPGSIEFDFCTFLKSYRLV